MKWSLKLGRFAGIDVYVHFTFLILLAILALEGWSETGDVKAAALGVGLFLAFFTCVLLHEFGHALTARHYGITTRDITLLPIGGVARLERIPDKPMQELWVALAGPAVNVVIASLLFAYLGARGQAGELFKVSASGGDFVAVLFWVNCMMIAFNLLPAFPMDGGRVLRALLAMKLDYARATRIAATVGQGMAVVFAVVGLRAVFGGWGSPFLMFIALFVWIGASQEAKAAERKSSLEGASVEGAMLTQFITLWPGQTLGAVAQLVNAGSQSDFPVVEDDRLIGLLTRDDLIAGLSAHGPATPVSVVMRREFPELSPAEPLHAALSRERPADLPLLPVVQSGRLVGLLTMQNVREFLMIKSALRRRHLTPQIPPVLPPPIPQSVPPRITPA